MNNALKPSIHGLFLAVICIIWASFSPNEVTAQLIATGSEALVNGTTQDNQQRPAAATGQLGSTIVAWESENLDGDGFAIAAQQYDAMGSITVAEFQVNTTTTNDQRFPDVAVADNGKFLITWMSFDQDGDGWGIYYKMYNAAGIVTMDETLANVTTTGQQQFPTVTMAAGGTFVISWVSDGEIFARMFDANGIATGSEFLVNTASTTFETNPDVASDNDGNFAIVWQSTDTTGTVDIDVYARLFDNSGVAAGAEFRLNSTTAESQIEPSIGMDTAGNFAVAWSSFLGDGDGYGIIFRRYDPNGSALSGETQVNSTTAGDQLHPYMAASADGEYIVTWTSFGQDGERGGIYGQHITSSGVLEGPETAVNTTTAENQIFPAVGFYDGEGTATIVWQDGDRVSSTSVDASNYGLIQRRFKVGTVALAKDITVALDATGNATIQPSDVDDGSTPGATLTLDITNFNCNDLGNNIVTLTATSSNGTMATAQSTVTVIDEIVPTVTTQPFDLVLDNQGMATLLVSDVAPSVSDNCTVASVTLAKTQFDCSDLGAQSISITATDESGNETITSAVVTVIDNQAPAALAQNITVQLDAAGSATVNTSQVDAGSIDNCSVTLSLDETTFSCDQAGQDVPVILTATDPSGNSSTANALVTVEDNTPPVVLAQNIVAILDQDGNAVITPSMVDNGTNDNCGFSLSLNRTNFTCLDVGLNALTLTATDPSGNSSSVNASVTIVDDEVPVALAQDITVQLDAAGNVSIDASQVDAGSSDNCSALLSVSPSTFDCTDIGDNSVLLSVSDAGGNIAVANATVTIEDNLAPAPIAQNITVQLDANGTATISATDIDNGSDDNCDVSLDLDITDFDCNDLGPNTVTLTATDGSGNSASASSTVTVVDNIPPLALAIPVVVALDANGVATINPNQIDGGSADNCGIASKTLSVTSFDCSNVGINSVTLTVTDASGNSSSATTNILVVDQEAPTVSATNINISLDGNGVATITPELVDNGSTDNCSLTLSLSQTDFDCDDLGPNTVTLTGTDNSGNTASATTTVFIIDEQQPVAVAQNITIQLDASGAASYSPVDLDNGSSDNCAFTLSASPLTFDCTDLGANTATLTATDATGNSHSTTATVTVEDNIPPVAVSQDITILLDDNGNATLTASDVDGGSSDNCSVASLSLSQSSFDCSHIGSNTVSLTVTDGSGNSSSAASTVTVVDGGAPLAVAQDITISLDQNGVATIVPQDVDGGSSDVCGAVALTIDRNSFDCDDVGDNTVTLTVTDATGNSSSAVSTVTVVDDIPPTITCQDVTISLDANGQAPANVFVIGALVSRSDNCGVQGSVGVTGPKVYNCDQIGTRSVRIFQNDVNGNVTTCDFNLTVVDELAPTAIAQDITLQLDANGNASITAADVDNGSSDNCSVELSIDKTDFNCADLGANTVTLTATDPSGNTSATTATVTVQDNVAPVVAAQDITIYLDNNGEAFTTAEDVDNGSSDNCGVADLSLSRTDFDCDEVGSNTVTLTATDAAGNSSSTTATVTVVDDIPPTITCQDVTISLDANGQAPANVFVIGALVSRSDNCGVQGSVGVTGPKVYNCDQIGTRSVRIFQNDVNGNVTTCDFNLTVVDELAPTAIAQDITVQLDANGNVSITAADIDSGSSDNCSVELSIDKSTFDCTDLGTNTVTLKATDPSGNASSTTATVTVEDNIAPVVSAQNTTVYLDANGQASITVEDIDNGSTDNCGLTLSIDRSEFDCDDVGNNTVTLSAIDIKGNVATAIATVTVVDDVPPVVACQDLTIQLDADGVAMIKPSDIENGSSDACGIASLSLDKDEFDCADVGANLVTLTAVDNNGNSSTCTATVTVQDNTPPVVVCQDITVALDVNGQVEISPSDLDGGSTDNCAIASLTIDKTNFNCDAIGDHIVTLTAVDVNGNTSTCTSTVTVIDDTAPEVYCVDVTISLDETGRADYSLRDAFENSTDNCGILFIGLAGGGFYDCDDLGQNTVTVIAGDFSGNIGVCQATVTVIDDTAPTVVTQDLTVYLDAAGNAAISAADVDAGTYDNCDFDLTLDVTSFDCNDLGANTVLLTATDPSGNVASQSATITVMDDISPVALAQDITVQLDATGAANIVPGMIDAGSFDNCAIASMSIDMSSFDCSNLGSNAVTLTVTDPAGNMHSATASVTVEDLIPPTVIAQDLTVSLDNNGGVTITPGMIDGGSFDNCQFDLALDITAFTCNDLGSNFVKLTATDISGLTSSQTVSVTVIDDLAPNAIAADLTIQLDGTGSASITPDQIDGGSTDNCSFTLTASPTSFDCSNLGTNAVILTVEDVAGNVSTAVANVTVEDNIAPLAVANDITIELDAAGNATITPLMLDGGSSDNCSIAQMTLDISSFSCADLGSNTVTLTVTDVAGNTDTESATVTVVDLAGPTVVTSDLTVSLDENGQASITTTMADGGSFDNCSATLDLSLSQNQFTCDDLGVNTVQLTATDGAGNSSTENLSVMVQDEIAPVAVAQDITVALDLTTGVAIVHPDDVDAGSSDNCVIVDKDLSTTEFDCGQLGPQTVTYSVTDAAGNTSSTTATVTVIIDGEVIPTAVCQDITIALDIDGKAEITAADVDGGSFDICGIKKFKLSKSKFSCKDLGTNTVKLTVENFYKNKSTCTATVTVVDNLAPTISKVPTSPVEYEAKKGCSTKVDFKKLKIKAKDNCGDASLSYSPSSGYFDVSEEPYVITVTATDESGNSSEETFEILVSKKTPKAKIKKLKAKDDLAKIEGDFDTKEVISLKVNWGDGTGNQSLEVKGKKFKGQHYYAMSGTYWVEVYLTDQCGGSHVLRKKVKVKIKDAPTQNLIASEESTRIEVELPRASMELSIYPNPFVSSMTVRFIPEISETIDVSLYSLDGKLIDRLHTGHVEVNRTYEWSFEDTDLISSGLYLLKIRGDEADLTRRVIYQKR